MAKKTEEPGVGHNGGPPLDGGIASDQLRSIVERVEKLIEEKQGVVDDIKDIFAEAKANGFDTKTIREVLKLRKQEPSERAEQAAIRELYLSALGMLT
jgi:uncharacterized protein (UPF0335 family)